MPNITLVRTSYTDKGTSGQLINSSGYPICLTLELPWRNNEAFVSCIPCGNYTLKRDIRHKGKKSECTVWEFQDVPDDRDQCQLHIANRTSQLQGCIAPVTNLGMLGLEYFGVSSRDAFKAFMKETFDLVELNMLITNQGLNPSYGNFYKQHKEKWNA